MIGDPNIDLGGQYAFITKGILSIAGIDINGEAKKALDAAIDPNTLTVAIPAEYAELNPVIQSAKLGDRGGSITAFLELSAKVPVSKLNEFIKSMCRRARTSGAIPENRADFCARIMRMTRDAYLRTTASYLRTSCST
jgi:hypothetical protein